VRDTGIGIPADRIDRLFQSFSQVDASTTRRFGGTGLGLAISKRLSELMGGGMWVESEADKGSTFHFTIRAEAAAAPTRAFLDELQPALQDKRALIVDDNATNLKILSRQLDLWRMQTEATASPLEALAWLKQKKHYDVAILDMQMPEMDGMGLARAIRALPQLRDLPLIMLTSLGRREVSEENELFAAFLTKPLKPSSLFDAMVGLFTGQETRVMRDVATSSFDPEMAEKWPLRLLLAEDNATNQKLALRILGRMGYQADVATNGLEVLAALERQDYDVVLMDMQMPELDGLGATRRLRKEFPASRQPHIIAMTANAMQGDRELCIAAGMNDYVSKPIRVEVLVEALKKSPQLGKREEPQEAHLIEVKASKPAEPSVSHTEPASSLNLDALRNLQQVLGDDFAFLAELIESFLEDAPQLLAEMQQYLEQGEASGVMRIAHSLKSNGADFGAMTLSALCKELEHLTKADRLDGADVLVAQIQAEFLGVMAALTAIREQGEVR
jgi:CheY-like chemotaxis protein